MFASTSDIARLWRNLTAEELERAEAVIEAVSDALRLEARKVGKDLDEMALDPVFANVLTSVVVDITARVLATNTEHEPISQLSQSALGYSQTQTYLVPGGGIFIKNSELARLGLKTQRIGTLEVYSDD